MVATASRSGIHTRDRVAEWGPDAPWTLLREAYYLLMKQRGETLRRFGLSSSEYAALRLCAGAPAMLSGIADAAGVTSAGATDVIDRLEARGLARRLPDPKDRRAVLVELTPVGRRLYREAQSTLRAIFRELSRTLSASEREALVTGISALVRSLSAAES